MRRLPDTHSEVLRLFLLAFALPRGIARVALGLLLGLQRCLSLCLFLFFPSNARGFDSRGLGFTSRLFGLGGFALQSRLFPFGGDRFALGAPLDDFGIIGPRLGAEFVQEILPRLLRRFLSVCKAGFFESIH
jgi:hypothetical protein